MSVAITHLDDRSLESSSIGWLLAVQALVMLPFVQQLPVWVVLGGLTALAWRGWITRNNRRLPPKWLLILVLALTGSAVIAQFGNLFGQGPGAALLILAMGLKQLETRRLRDAMIGVYLGYFTAAVQFLFNQSIPTVVYLLLVVIGMTAAQIGLNEGPAISSWRQKLKASTSLLLLAIPFMIVLFVLFPRLSGPLWSTPENKQSARTGLSESMSPGQISQLSQSNEIAFRVTFEGEAPPPASRYWRGPVLWSFDGRTWSSPDEGDPEPRPEPDASADIVEYTVSLEPHDQRWLLALDIPLDVPPEAYQTRSFQLLAWKPVKELRQYRVRSATQYAIGLELSDWERLRGLRLPSDSAPRARSLAANWREEGLNGAALIQRALAFFNREPFFYTLSPQRLGDEPVDEFLFETREGFCEHYASSFVVLMRAAGIPARVVTGYQGGEFNPLGDYLRVRQADAHAWAEVWLPEQGWLRVDPTAAVAPERIELGIGAALADAAELPASARGSGMGLWRFQLSLFWDTVNYYWNDWVLSFGPEQQRELLRKLKLDRFGWGGLLIGLISTLGLIALSYAAFVLWRDRDPVRDPTLRAYRRFCRKLDKAGLPKRPEEGPRDYAQRVSRERPDLAEHIVDITQRYIGLRYADMTRTNTDELIRAVSRFHPRPSHRSSPKKKPAEAG